MHVIYFNKFVLISCQQLIYHNHYILAITSSIIVSEIGKNYLNRIN